MPPSTPPADPFLRLPAVLDLIGLSTPSLYRRIANGTFPKPVTLGANSRAWRLSELQAWQDARVAARDSGADAPLRAMTSNIGRGRRDLAEKAEAAAKPKPKPKPKRRVEAAAVALKPPAKVEPQAAEAEAQAVAQPRRAHRRTRPAEAEAAAPKVKRKHRKTQPV